MISSKIEESRIVFALRGCKKNDYEIFEAKDLIARAIKEYGDNLAVSCSFGNCSIAVLNMARDLNPRIKVVFNNTGVQYQETYAYRDLLVKEWDLNLIETKPIKSFWECVKEHGLPTIRRQYYHSYARRKALKKKRHTFQEKTGRPACCWFCKEKPFLNACREHDIKATLVGLRVSESRARMYFGADYGQAHFTKRHKLMKYNPILFWTQEDLNLYFKEHDLPQSEVYTKLGLQRNGCMPCTGFLNWEKQLARINRKMYRYIQKLRGVSLIDDFLKLEEQAFNNCNQALPSKRQSFLENWF